MWIKEGSHLLGCVSTSYLSLERAVMSVSPLKSSTRGYLFSGCILVSVEVRPVSKNRSCSWYATAPDCPSSLVRLCLLADQYSPAHFSMGLGGETKCYISLYSQLFVLHSRSTWDSCEWVSGCKCIQICDITDCCFIFCWQKSSWGFVLYTDIWQVH